MNSPALSGWQRRIVILGWVTYGAYYLGRVNISAALPALESDLGWSPSQIGVLAGASLWTYALGQIINGWLGSFLNPRHMVFAGIVGSTAINLLFALLSSLPLMMLLWLANGFLQAMGWGPVLRTLSSALNESQRQRIAGIFGASYVVGNVVTWALTGVIIRLGHWRLIFVIPPLLMLAIGIMWYIMSAPAAQRAPLPSSRALPAVNPAAALAIARHFWHFLLASLVAGALITGVLIYAPSYVAQTMPLDQAVLSSISFPVFGLLGTAWLSGWAISRLNGNVIHGVLLLLILTAASRLLVFILPPSLATSLILLGAMGITSYALTNVVLTTVPLTTHAQAGTSAVAGMMDATHSIGGALGSILVGVLLDWGGWGLVFGVWALLPLVTAYVLYAGRSERLQQTDAEEI